MAASLTAMLAQLNADLVLDSRSISATASISATFSNLDGTIGWADTSNSQLRPLTDGGESLTAGDILNTETFSVTVSGLSDYTWGAGSLSGLTAANIDGGNAGFGVVGSTDSRIDALGEAVLVTFDLTGLTEGTHSSDFVLRGLAMNRWTDTADFFNYAVYDSSGDLKHTGGENIGTAAIAFADLDIANGDVLVIGFDGDVGTSEFAFDTFTVDVVPEPSAYALIGGILALGSVMMRRRRS
ncbi:MAG: PEP-CTERM sorting domain-containing protein [Coraliomargarita sp.]